MSAEGLKIRRLRADSAGAMEELLARQSSSYREHFFPFAEESKAWLERMLSEARQDIYEGVFFEREMIGFFMLRGMDGGFERPSFGVLVDEAFRGKGLGRLCLAAALAECRLRNFPGCMLKVAPENEGARRLYQSVGFEREGVCDSTGHDIFAIRFGGGEEGDLR